jgi:hypothetical protein
MSLWTSTKPTARKPHRCDNCDRTIDPGETYRRGKGLREDGGGFDTWKECAHCLAFLSAAPIVDWCWNEGYSRDDFQEFEPRTDDECRWHADWKRGWRDDMGALVPLPVKPAEARCPANTAGSSVR